MNINQLQYFVEIVNCGNLSKAADNLYISPSSMSKQIKALETELGVDLFIREHSKIFVSPIGREFYEYATEALARHNDILVTIGDYNAEQSMQIRLGSIPIVSSCGISTQIAKFTASNKKYSQVIIDMHENSQKDVLNELVNNIIDMAFIRTDFLENMESYDVLNFLKDHFVLVCNKNHPLCTTKKIDISDIKKYPMSILSPNSGINASIMDYAQRNNVELNIQCFTTRHKILMEIIQNNDSITLLPESLVDFSLYPNLMTISLKEEITSQVALVKLKTTKLNRISRDFWSYWQTNFTRE